MTTIYVDNIAPNLQSKVSAPNLTLPTGSMIQVQSTNMTSHQTIGGQTFVEISALTTSITPSSSSSKIYINVNVNTGAAHDDCYTQFRVQRVISGSGTNLGVGDALGSCSQVSWQNNNPYTHAIYENHSSSWSYLDSPNTTLPITYKILVRPMENTTARTILINRPSNTTDGNRGSTSSTLTLMEIAG